MKLKLRAQNNKAIKNNKLRIRRISYKMKHST